MNRTHLCSLLLSSIALGGCGAARPPTASEPRTFTSVEDAEAELSRAEAQLPAVAAATPPGAAAAPAQPGYRVEEKTPPKDGKPDPATTKPAKPDDIKSEAPPTAADRGPAPQKAAPRAQEKGKDDEEGAPTPCQTACRAFASMQRAAESVCRLAGESDARCDGAKKRVENAKARVAHCGCGA